MENPFVYARPVGPDELIDRDDETKQLLDLLRGGHHCRLAAPRRYGKTSLIERVRRDADLEGLPSVYVNFYGILSLEEAVERLERGYRELRGPLARWLRGRIDALDLSVSTPAGSASVSAGGKRTERRLHDLLDLPTSLHARSGVRVLVCFDEFQEVLSTRVALDGVIRSVIERHRDQAAYLFAGSQPGLMRSLFEARERPFYGQARAVSLGPLRAEDVTEHLGARFDAGRRDVDDVLSPLIAVTRGHPQRTMMLAHFLWERIPPGEAADHTTFAVALLAVMEELAEAFDRAWRGLDDGARRTLAAIVASDDGRPMRAAALAAADVPRTTVAQALPRLADDAIIIAAGARHEIVDPLFARWIAQGRQTG